ncbi:MAG TPA: type II toxin-antitoxin system antitoxin SocA domain-containing protein [Nocardioides sp.]|jgi:uncharacterized phage-associated protein|uniref:Panacea domain-containing protein n=1 Tax=Nocardioides sp. TaxID=35761 RepID=UPI002E326B46|nr:type II toxin-antitoxin system antitoxin SocA domain-containing protein [Nocardioides sp.]HEX3932652.1 type II toxin-antitoxin system antitoxin SocA domain-containing protein [Nocardioides sp.]
MFDTVSLPRTAVAGVSMISMAFSAHEVAQEIKRRIPGVGSLKVHKLLYYSQGHHLASLGRPLFRDTISAWDMGPVVGTLWYEERTGSVEPAQEDCLDEAALNTIGYVVSRYGGLTGGDLIRLSHSEPPWIEANSRRPAGQSARIEQDSIRTYFARVEDEDDETGPRLDAQLLKEFLSGAEEVACGSDTVDSLDEIAARHAALIG